MAEIIWICNIFCFLATGSAVIDQLPLNATAKAALKTAPVLVAGVSSSVSTLTDRILSANFADLYARSKRLICCDVTGILHNLWIAWTIAGALAGTLAVLLTYKVQNLVSFVWLCDILSDRNAKHWPPFCCFNPVFWADYAD